MRDLYRGIQIRRHQIRLFPSRSGRPSVHRHRRSSHRRHRHRRLVLLKDRNHCHPLGTNQRWECMTHSDSLQQHHRQQWYLLDPLMRYLFLHRRFQCRHHRQQQWRLYSMQQETRHRHRQLLRQECLNLSPQTLLSNHHRSTRRQYRLRLLRRRRTERLYLWLGHLVQLLLNTLHQLK